MAETSQCPAGMEPGGNDDGAGYVAFAQQPHREFRILLCAARLLLQQDRGWPHAFAFEIEPHLVPIAGPGDQDAGQGATLEKLQGARWPVVLLAT